MSWPRWSFAQNIWLASRARTRAKVLFYYREGSCSTNRQSTDLNDSYNEAQVEELMGSCRSRNGYLTRGTLGMAESVEGKGVKYDISKQPQLGITHDMFGRVGEAVFFFWLGCVAESRTVMMMGLK